MSWVGEGGWERVGGREWVGEGGGGGQPHRGRGSRRERLHNQQHQSQQQGRWKAGEGRSGSRLQ